MCVNNNPLMILQLFVILKFMRMREIVYRNYIGKEPCKLFAYEMGKLAQLVCTYSESFRYFIIKGSEKDI